MSERVTFKSKSPQDLPEVPVGNGVATALTTATPTIDAMFGVVVQAPSTNTASIWVGGSGVTAANGLELVAGKSILFPVNDPSKIFVIASSAGQKARVLYI